MEAARRRKKDDEVADKMRLLSEARQLVERDLQQRVDSLERQVRPRGGTSSCSTQLTTRSAENV